MRDAACLSGLLTQWLCRDCIKRCTGEAIVQQLAYRILLQKMASSCVWGHGRGTDLVGLPQSESHHSLAQFPSP